MGSHDLFFCPGCGSVQPANMDTASDQYFQMFGMDEPVFSLDPQQLEKTYKGLQRQLHPDKFSTASPLEKEYAHQQAAVVNAAYDVLKKPLRRAHYILNHEGFGACEGMTITDPELLMSVMEAREEVEEAGSDRAVLQPLLDRMQGLEAGCVQELAQAFAAGDLSHAAELTTQLRYICRIKEAILDKM